jgi:uncharacterized membrane protein required for colicin V production
VVETMIGAGFAALLFAATLLVLVAIGYLIAWAIHDFRLGALKKQLTELEGKFKALEAASRQK